MKKVVCCGALNFGGYPPAEEFLRGLREEGFDFVFPVKTVGKPLSGEERKRLFDALKDADGFIPGGIYVSDEVLSHAPRLKALVFSGTGYSTYIDVDACKRRGVDIGYCPGANAVAVSEFASALLVSGIKNIPWFNAQVKGNAFWTPQSTPDIHDKVLGFWGLGNVGFKLARIMRHGYGCKILYHDQIPKPQAKEVLDAEERNFEELLAESDVFILGVLLTPETTGMINKERIDRMKDGVILLNFARSEIVDTPAVLKALESGKISKYITDVFHSDTAAREEVVKWKGKYPGDDKLIVTPHTCFYAPSTGRQMEVTALETIKKLLRGEDIPNKVR
jgi:lactate dehydrogenase-like 2-hydroxyacid dehydrogenase